MTITSRFYRLWREAHDAGLRLTPAHHRDPATGELLDHAYAVTGPRPCDTMRLVTSDLEAWLAAWLAGWYADPAARAHAAAQALSP
jgi:hypothetical protein